MGKPESDYGVLVVGKGAVGILFFGVRAFASDVDRNSRTAVRVVFASRRLLAREVGGVVWEVVMYAMTAAMAVSASPGHRAGV